MASAYGRNLKFGFQNIYHKESGAFTGENSVLAAKDLGLSHILIGHSERRQYFNESNENCRSKIELCSQHKLIPMYCIGETEEERNLGTTQSTVGKQLLEGLPTEIKGPIILAYEPVWAIGTGNVASPEDAQKVHSFIRNLLLDSYGKEIAEKTQILYGGSVKGKNAGDLFGQTDIDGGLVGGASLKADSFYEIIEKSNA